MEFVLNIALLLFLGLGHAVFAQAPAGGSAAESEIVKQIDRAEQYRESHLGGYAVIEHYTIKNSHFNSPAEIAVRAEYKRGTGKSYQVLSRTGPSMLKDKVLDRILQEQTQMSNGEARKDVLVTSANYQFHLVGEESVANTRCWALEITPRVKSPHLLKGKVWVDREAKTLVRIEGKPPSSSSFFAGRPDVVREYGKVDGFALAERSHAVSSGFIQGNTEVDIRYEGYQITRTP